MTASRYIHTGPRHLAVWLGQLWDPTFVYVIQGDPDTPIKVGFARDVLARITTLQTGYPWRLRLLYVIPGDHHLEWYLHQRLKGVKLRGEWFKPDDSFLDYVADLAQRMLDAWDGAQYAPYYGDMPEIRDALPASKQRHPVTVSQVEPDPAMSPDQIKQLERLRVWYGSSSVQVTEFQRACSAKS